MFRVFSTKEFDDEFDGLDESEKQKVRKIMQHLREQGGSVGKPLGLPYFREKKFDDKRVYYLVYEDFSVVLTIAISDKRAQQATINKIYVQLDKYRNFVIDKLRELKD